MSNSKSFDEMGRGYQEKVIQALFEDHIYAEMMADVVDPEYFTFSHLKVLAETFFSYRFKYREFPSLDVALLQITTNNNDAALVALVADFAKRVKTTPLNGDKAWIEEDSLEFCKRQKLVAALGDCLDQVENKKYDSIAGTIRQALDKGSPKDHGHDYSEEVDKRAEKSIRKPIKTGWPTLDSKLGGGWERKTITTFIAPTGAGKSMFLVNCSAALVSQGLNVLYVTLEMADYKIGLRHDSWFSGLSIDDSSKPENKEKVKQSIAENVKGRLIIKEWPTKRATVETIRGHIQRLIQIKQFKPDAIIIDYPDLLRSTKSYGEKRHDLESNYEELRGLAMELDCIMIVADQTNRGALESELVTISAIAESYAKATVCDLIITISRTPEDKMQNTGRLFIAKSRLGSDGIILPFIMNTGKNVRVELMEQNTDPITLMMKDSESAMKFMRDRVAELSKKPEKLSEVAESK